MTELFWVQVSERLKKVGAEHELKWIKEESLAHSQPEARVNEVVERRIQGEPLAYIFGSWPFWGREFAVGPGVLIPRPETEELVEKTLERLRGGDFEEALRIFDAGSGSGCIGLSLALESGQKTQVVLSEKSPEALPWLKKNCATWCQMSRLVEAELWAASWNDFKADRSLDVLISNPPYVAGTEWSQVEESVLRFEPKSALFPEDLDRYSDATGPYRELLECGERWLKSGGLLAFELGPSQARWILDYAQQLGPWTDCELLKDIAGKDRFFFARRRA